MVLKYSEQDVKGKVIKALRGPNEKVYALPIINHKGEMKDSKIPYTEFIIEELYTQGFFIDNDELQDTDKVFRKGKNPQTGEEIIKDDFPTKKISRINPITRQKSYYTKSHSNPKINVNSKREEENFIKGLKIENHYNDTIGEVLDYQIPLRSDENDKNIKCFDLLTYKPEANELFIAEAKKDKSPETLLRACLEVQTYFQIVDRNKLKLDFTEEGFIGSENVHVKKAVLIFEDSQAAKEYNEVIIGKRPNLERLLEDLNITVWVI